MRNALRSIAVVKPSLQFFIALESRELTSISEAERRAVIQRLAHLILEATGVGSEEIGDDEC